MSRRSLPYHSANKGGNSIILFVVVTILIILLITLLYYFSKQNLYSYSQTTSSPYQKAVINTGKILSNDPVDCKGSWTNWSECTTACNGEQTRKFVVEQQALNGGKECPTKETQSCNTVCLTNENLETYFIGNEPGIALPTYTNSMSSCAATNNIDCAQRCVNNPHCEAYGFVADTGRCDLFDFTSASLLEFGDGQNPIGWPNYIVGVRLDNRRKIKDDESLNKYFDTSNQSQFGPAIDRTQPALSTRVASGLDLYTCTELCNDDKTCVAYGYFTDSMVCDLYHNKLTQKGQVKWKNYKVGKKRIAGYWE